MATERRRLALLVVSGLLFSAWIGWLGFLAWKTSNRGAILSRPQFLISQVDVIAELSGDESHPNAAVTVVSVEWPDNPRGVEAGQKIEVLNLPQSGAIEGWTGPGRYLLALVRDGHAFRLAPIPRSPGFGGRDQPPIYPVNPQTIAQYEGLKGEK